jgi:hypothetical protein
MHPCDNTDDYFCNFCNETENDGCDKDCLFTQLEKLSNNLTSVKYNTFKNLILEISHGETASTVCHHMHLDFCAFCDKDSDHESNGIVSHVRSAIGLVNENDREYVEALLNSEKIEALFYEAVNAFKEHKDEIIKLEKERKRKEAEAIKNEKISRTCRYCQKVLKTKAGRLHHEKESSTCRDQFLAAHPNYKGHRN